MRMELIQPFISAADAVFAGEDGIVHHQVADRLAVLAAF